MKKSVIALAAMAVVGGASAQVTISGIMDAYVGSGNSFGQKYSVVGQSGARTTTFKFNGVEDLGGGKKAHFQYEIQPQFVASDGNAYNTTGWGGAAAANGVTQAGSINQISSGMVGKGQSYLGLNINDLDIRLGTNNTSAIDTTTNASMAFGTGVGSAYGAGFGSTSTNTFTRFEESVKIITPTMNGFKATYLTTLKNDSQYGSTTGGVTLRRPAVTEFGAQYQNGPLQANASLITSRQSPNEATAAPTNNYTALSSNVTTKYNSYSASYDLGVAKLGYENQKVKNDAGFVLTSGATTLTTIPGAVDSTFQMMFVQVPMGNMRLIAGSGKYALNKSPASVLMGNKNTITSLGLDYDLSKRTYVYGRFQSGNNGASNAATTIVNGAVDTATAGQAAQLKTQSFNLGAIGISHAF